MRVACWLPSPTKSCWQSDYIPPTAWNMFGRVLSGSDATTIRMWRGISRPLSWAMASRQWTVSLAPGLSGAGLDDGFVRSPIRSAVHAFRLRGGHRTVGRQQSHRHQQRSGDDGEHQHFVAALVHMEHPHEPARLLKEGSRCCFFLLNSGRHGGNPRWLSQSSQIGPLRILQMSGKAARVSLRKQNAGALRPVSGLRLPLPAGDSARSRRQHDSLAVSPSCTLA